MERKFKVYEVRFQVVVIDPDKVGIHSLQSAFDCHLDDFGEGQFWHEELDMPSVIVSQAEITEM